MPLGNDIIDLRREAGNDASDRFAKLELIFSGAEQDFILGAANPVWARDLLWSMKRSGWKAWKCLTGMHKYNPLLFQTELIEPTSTGAIRGRITCGDLILDSQSFVGHRFIHTISLPSGQGFDSVVQGQITLPRHPSAPPSEAIHEACIASLSYEMGIAPDRLAITRALHCPYGISLDGRPLNTFISLSQDGRLAAYAYQHVS